MNDILTVAVKNVAALRRDVAAYEDIMKVATADFQNIMRGTTQKLIELKQEKDAQEALLRELALEAYAATGEKKPAAGVEVKVKTAFKYAAEKALEWALAHGIAIVPAKLDGKTFERVIAAMPERPDWIVAADEPFVTIATDLEKALESTHHPLVEAVAAINPTFSQKLAAEHAGASE